MVNPDLPPPGPNDTAGPERPQPEAEPNAAAQYPRVLPGVLESRVSTDSGAVNIKHPTQSRYFAVSPGVITILTRMDGTRSTEHIGSELGVPKDRVDAVVEHLGALGIVGTDGGELAEPDQDQDRTLRDGVVDLGLPPWLARLLFINLDIVSAQAVVDPLYRHLRLHRVFGTTALVLLLVVGAVTTAAVLNRPGLVPQAVDTAFDPRWWWVVLVPFVVKRIFHEMGHALACRHYGQPLGRFGIGFFFFLPVVYVNVSSAWLIPDRRPRLWIHAGGLLGDVTLLVTALSLLAVMPDAAPVQALFGYTLLLVALSFVLNLNPLMKLDGYFLLCDAIGIRNLRERAFGVLFTRVRRTLGRFVPRIRPGAFGGEEKARETALVLYAVFSLGYTAAVLVYASTRVSSWITALGMNDVAATLPYVFFGSLISFFVFFVWRRSVVRSRYSF